jgi:uncharacterized protein with von Willebrand factor type A (vWA) domain
MTTAPTQSDSRGALDKITASMSALPPAIFAAVATNAVGTLAERAEGVRVLRSALGRGQVPAVNETAWPSAPVQIEVFAWLKDSGLARRCAESPELADEVTLSVLDHATAGERFSTTEADRLCAELRAIEAARKDLATESAESEGSRREHIKRQEAQARQTADAAAAKMATDQMATAWGERLRAWAAIEQVFGELGGMCGLGWDLSRTVLRHTGWQDAKRLADLLKKLPQIQDVVRQLGRMQSAEKPEETPILERLFGPVRRAPAELCDIDTPAVPHDTHGVERSGEIARMLPSEAVLFMRPALRLLWHAKRAERALATYRVRGVDQERFIADDAGSEARDAERRKKKQDRGPIIVCLDTSGSMQGAPETVAKAVTLEAVRIATAERRECFLYAFSGPTQVAEFDLSVKKGGVQALLEFLGCSFHGGTDVAEPIARAIKRVETAKWSRADAIIVSDGEFPVPSATSDAVASARKSLYLRVHGLLIGAGHSAAMTALCDPIHVFKDWNALAQGRHI